MTTLEKIRDEISSIEISGQIDINTSFVRTSEQVKNMALEIIDKYAEQEPTDEWQNGYDMAWEEAEVFYEQEPCDDVVSRQAVKDLFCRICMENNICYRSKDTCEDLKLFDQLPSVRPQEQTGHWLYSGENGVDRWTCDNCFDFVKKPTKVCPNCKAKMVEPQESEVRNEDNT